MKTPFLKVYFYIFFLVLLLNVVQFTSYIPNHYAFLRKLCHFDGLYTLLITKKVLFQYQDTTVKIIKHLLKESNLHFYKN